MIDINATFFLQAFHFFIVWWGVDRFFFRSVVRTIQEDDLLVGKLQQLLAQERTSLEAENSRRALLWEEHRKQFKLVTPGLVHKITPSAQSVVCPVCFEMDSSVKKKLVDQAAALIVQRVVNE